MPLVYALLSDKTEKSYVFFLTILRDAFGVQISHGLVMIDFELAAVNAFQKVFEQFMLQLCFSTSAKAYRNAFIRSLKLFITLIKGLQELVD